MTFSLVYLFTQESVKSQSRYIILFADAHFVLSGWICTDCLLFKRIIITEENGNGNNLSDNKTRVTIVIVVNQTDLFEEKWKKG